MSDQQRTGGGERKGDVGYLFENKKTNPKQPDWRGKATINGKEMLVSGWNRDTPDGTMISFSFTDPATLPQRPAQGQGSAPAQGASRPAAAPAPAATPAAPTANYEQSLLDDLDDLFKPDNNH